MSLRVTGRNTDNVLLTCGQNLVLPVMKLFQILQFLTVLCHLELLPLLIVEFIQNLWLNKRKRETRNTRKLRLKLFKRKLLSKPLLKSIKLLIQSQLPKHKSSKMRLLKPNRKKSKLKLNLQLKNKKKPLVKLPKPSLKTKTMLREMAKTKEAEVEVEEETEVEVNTDQEATTTRTEKTRMKMDSKLLRRTTRPTIEEEVEAEEEVSMKEEVVTTRKEVTEEEVVIEEIEVAEVTEVTEAIEEVEPDQLIPEKDRSSPQVNKFPKPPPSQLPLPRLPRNECLSIRY